MGATAVLVIGAMACDGDEDSPWLFCTTNPCRPLALPALPTPPALSKDDALAAPCDLVDGEPGKGILLWHTDWDPLTQEGRCVTRQEAERLGANVR